jgi:hypothetical protein
LWAVLVLSFAAPFAFPDWSGDMIGVLEVMHITVAIITVWVVWRYTAVVSPKRDAV